MKKILIVDDEQDLCELLQILLEEDGFQVKTVNNGKEAVDIIDSSEILDLIISDLKMPKMSGTELHDYLIENRLNIPIIFITSYGTVNDAVEAMKKGAADFITKPFNTQVIRHTVNRVIKIESLQKENTLLKKDILDFQLIYKSEEMKQVIEVAQRVAKTKSTVLILGNSGTGKDLVARKIHSINPNRPFVKIHCPTVPESLIESELFGYKKGAFTNATCSFTGKVKIADGGILFLDEIGDIPLSVQPKLLRLLEEKRFEPLGSNSTVNVDFQVICATNQDLEEMVREGKFRQDLYYRINTITIRLIDLTDRKEDIIPLAEFFLDKFALELGRKHLTFSEESRLAMNKYHWPGNIRELRNVVERAVVLGTKNIILPADLPTCLSIRGQIVDKPCVDVLDNVQQDIIKTTLQGCRGNVSAAARELGIARDALRYRIKKYGL